MSSPSRIAKILVQQVNSVGDVVEFCRLAAKELSDTVKPVLDKNNIRLIGVGFDTRFVKPFVQEGYFAGELFVDTEKKCYEALQYKRFGFLDLMKLLFTAKWRDAQAKAKGMNISGDIKGDGFQNGGALVIDKGGKQLFEYIQEDAAEHISAEQIFKAFKINP